VTFPAAGPVLQSAAVHGAGAVIAEQEVGAKTSEIPQIRAISRLPTTCSDNPPDAAFRRGLDELAVFGRKKHALADVLDAVARPDLWIPMRTRSSPTCSTSSSARLRRGAAEEWAFSKPSGAGGSVEPKNSTLLRKQVSAPESAVPVSARSAAPRLNRPFIIALLLANFGSNVALIAPIQNLLPRMIEQASGASGKALGLGIVTGIGALAALVFNPIAGHFTDRWVKADNRAFTVLFGLVAGATGHAFLAYQHSIIGIAVWWTVCQATINIAYSPMSAVIVDHVDRRSWGLVWGLVSVAQAFGLIIGLAAVVLVFPSTTGGMMSVAVGYAIFLIPLVIVLYRLPRVRNESPDAVGTRPRQGLTAGNRPAFRALLGGRGFRSVMAAKFLIMLAETIALLYIYYYLQDDIRYPDPGHGQLILILIATLAAIVATVTVGRIADQSGSYRRYAVLASVLMAATGFVLAGITEWTLVIVCAFTLGAGYGAFESVSQALSLTVLPDPSRAGRDLGILNIASAVPQVIGAPVAGLVIAELGGYRGLFVFAALLAVAAAFVFSWVPSDPPALSVTDAP
jgi:MFS family permease